MILYSPEALASMSGRSWDTGHWLLSFSSRVVSSSSSSLIQFLCGHLSIGADEKLLVENDTSSSVVIAQDIATKKKLELVCDLTGRSEFCEIEGDIRIDGKTFTVFIVSQEPYTSSVANTTRKIRPYGRKEDSTAMKNVKEWSVKVVANPEDAPKCIQSHNVPGILFSTGGYAGNYYHAFTDVIIPLFSTARVFRREVKFLVTDKSWWTWKFQTLMKGLSKYELINVDNAEDIHCFTGATVGLKGRSYKELSIDTSKSAYTMKDFREFLRSTYSLNKTTAIKMRDGEKKRPQLLIISRKRTRAFTNVDKISKMAEKLGFEVVIAEPEADISGFAQIINSCDVVMGVHGAGLTNSVFLPDNAILIQVVPFGMSGWVPKVSFEEPANDMQIRYLEYKIRLEESTLIKQYPPDHVVLKNPSAIQKQGWSEFASIYLVKQNVKIDVRRFRRTLKIVPVCDIGERSDYCEIEGDIRVDGKTGNVFIISSETDILAAENISWSIRPYARKGDQAAMSAIREWSIKFLPDDHQDVPKCTQNHKVPAILFSLGGYAGNHFHAFTDIIVPLFATARPFSRQVQFLVTDKQYWWIAKFQNLLDSLSGYEHIDIDKAQDIHCFSSLTLGLKGRSRKELSIDPSKSPYTIKDFRQFLRSSYALKKKQAIKISDGEKKRPRLLIISRKRSRAFTNIGEIAKMARRLGFRVVIAEPDADMSGFARIINSCDVVMGVHGAGLTNIVFLPENAILVQVIPFGGTEWVSKTYFEDPLKDMNLRYLEYKIGLQESTLIQQYPSDHVVLRDPSVIQKQGWEAFKSTYLDKQNVKLDVNRFRPTLVKALELLHE
ncbi:hypothetical protein Tsubulata_017381, partial [Turnera subulata]